MTVLQTLKQRKLVQWALAYVAGAWVVLEVFDLFDGRFNWPSWLFSVLLALLAVGFLITLVLAWYHGERGRQRVTGAELLVIAGLLVVAGLLSSSFLGMADAPPERAGSTAETISPEPMPTRPRIAVLPLANRSSGEEDRPFVDGIHDEILSQLSKIRSLELTPLISVLEYRDSPKSARLIGKELGASYVVEGSVQRVENRVRLRASLIDAASDRVIWNDDYDRDLTVAELLDVQRDIALEVATSLGAEVLPVEADRLSVEGPTELVAYERYLTGLSHLRAIEQSLGDQSEAYQGAVESLTAAIAAEPSWAAPHAALGTAYHWMASRGVDSEVNWPRSKAALERALELDTLFAPAWASLGFVRYFWEGDAAGAEAAYRRTREGPPGIFFLAQGRHAEAVAAYERAVSLDPRSRVLSGQLGWAQVCAEEYERAVESLREWLRTSEGGELDTSLRSLVAYALLKSGRRDEATSILSDLEASESAEGSLALLFALAGDANRAERFLARAEAAPRDDELDMAAQEAAAAVALGQRERALAFLERTVQSAPRSLQFLQCLEEVRSLEGDPRYEKVLESLGIGRRGGTRETN